MHTATLGISELKRPPNEYYVDFEDTEKGKRSKFGDKKSVHTKDDFRSCLSKTQAAFNMTKGSFYRERSVHGEEKGATQKKNGSVGGRTALKEDMLRLQLDNESLGKRILDRDFQIESLHQENNSLIGIIEFLKEQVLTHVRKTEAVNHERSTTVKESESAITVSL